LTLAGRILRETRKRILDAGVSARLRPVTAADIAGFCRPPRTPDEIERFVAARLLGHDADREASGGDVGGFVVSMDGTLIAGGGLN
jgi:hypothetical protein